MCLAGIVAVFKTNTSGGEIVNDITLRRDKRLLISHALTLATFGIVAALAGKILPMYIKTARLLEPAGLAKDIQHQMVIDSALTGNWPDGDSLVINMERYANSVSTYEITPEGNIDISLSIDEPELIGRKFAFNLGELESGNGIVFYSWRCGNASSPEGYKFTQPLTSTVPLLYSYSICRK